MHLQPQTIGLFSSCTKRKNKPQVKRVFEFQFEFITTFPAIIIHKFVMFFVTFLLCFYMRVSIFAT